MKAIEIKEYWRNKGKIVKVFDKQLFVIDEGDKASPVIVILHGYPSSSLDYMHVLPLLTLDYRVIVHDHLGFGFSDKPIQYSYSLIEQAEYALELWKSMEVNEAHLVAHDYGTSVATEILARRQRGQKMIKISTITLSNGSIHIELANLRWVQKLLKNTFWGPIIAKFSTEFIYVHQMKRLWYNERKVNIEELRALWLMNSHNNGKEVLHKITLYLNERYKYWNRWINALETLNIPTHILWAENDPVAIIDIAEKLHLEIPESKLTRLANLGHYPMLEAPELWASELLNFINKVK